MTSASDLLPQVDLEAEIRRVSALLDQATRKFLMRARRAAKADSDYKRAYAIALLSAEGPNRETREARATLDAADLYDQKKIADAVVASARFAADNYRDQLSALMAINANQRYLINRGASGVGG